MPNLMINLLNFIKKQIQQKKKRVKSKTKRNLIANLKFIIKSSIYVHLLSFFLLYNPWKLN